MTEKHIHEQPELCDHILSTVEGSSVRLRIAESAIKNAGSGLFAVDDVPAGGEIFRSQPLLIVSEGNNSGLCDYCLASTFSAVAPNGKFYMGDGDEGDRAKLQACLGCHAVQYCSKECQKKAWRSYHKYECSVIAKVKENNKNMGTMPQALCRLILWLDNKVISKQDLEVIVNLETHYDDRNNKWQEKYGDGSDAPLEGTFVTAHNVKQAAESSIDWKFATQLYCMLMTNAGGICPAEEEIQHGSFLDLVVSMMNHSCDANAHTFFEGRELRVRALKDIPAGTEITVNYYPCPKWDVLLRRSTLKNYMFITCNCKQCRDEMTVHVAAAVSRQDHLARLRSAQLELHSAIDSAELAFRISRTVDTCLSFQRRITSITDRGFPAGDWPDHMEPLPTVFRTLGRMYRDLGYVLGLEFVLKGTLCARGTDAPALALQLEHAVKHLFFLAQAPDGDIMWTGARRRMELVRRAAVRDLARGYLCLACVACKLAFGLDSAYCRAVHDFAGHSVDCDLDPRIDTDEFRERYAQSQADILTWARVDLARALELPSRERLAELRRDIEMVWADKVPRPAWAVREEEQKQEQEHKAAAEE